MFEPFLTITSTILKPLCCCATLPFTFRPSLPDDVVPQHPVCAPLKTLLPFSVLASAHSLRAGDPSLLSLLSGPRGGQLLVPGGMSRWGSGSSLKTLRLEASKVTGSHRITDGSTSRQLTPELHRGHEDGDVSPQTVSGGLTSMSVPVRWRFDLHPLRFYMFDLVSQDGSLPCSSVLRDVLLL